MREQNDIRVCISQLTDIPKQQRRVKIPLNISLFKWLDLAREHVFYIQGNIILFFDTPTDEVKRK